MKKLRTILTSALLCAAMAVMAPAQTIASAEESKEDAVLYVSEVKIGMGETSEEATKELLAEVFIEFLRANRQKFYFMYYKKIIFWGKGIKNSKPCI